MYLVLYTFLLFNFLLLPIEMSDQTPWPPKALAIVFFLFIIFFLFIQLPIPVVHFQRQAE